MSDDHFGSTPKIELHSLERIGRELRGLYETLPQEPFPENLLRALHGLQDAGSGLPQLREAAEALRRADNPRPGRLRAAARLWHTSPAAKRR